MGRDEKLDLLRTVPLFSGLSNREITRLGVLAEEIDLPADRILMGQGERGSEMMVIADGSARVERDGTRLGDVGNVAIVGEIALLDGGPRSATVTMTAPPRLLILEHREFHQAMDELPEIQNAHFETVAGRLRTLEPAAVH